MKKITLLLCLCICLAGYAADIIIPDDQATLVAAVTSASTGDTIRIKANTYTNQNYLTTAVLAGKILNIEPYGDGNVTYKPTDGSYSVLVDTTGSAELTITGITFDQSAGTREEPINISGGACTVSVNNCTITAKRALKFNSTGSATYTNCTFTQSATPGTYMFELLKGTLTISDGTYSGSTSLVNVNNECNEVTIDGVSCNTSFIRMADVNAELTTATITDCIGDLTGSIFYKTAGTTTTTFTMSGCNFGVSATAGNLIRVLGNDIAANLILSDNQITGVTGGVSNVYFIDSGYSSATDGTNAGKILSAYITDNTLSAIKSGINIQKFCTDTYIARNDISLVETICGAGIYVGVEASGTNDNALTGTKVIENNVIIMSTNTAHSIFVGLGADNFVVRGNTVRGGNYGIILKGNANTVFQNSIRSINCINVGGSSNNQIFNNTCVDIGTGGSTYAFKIMDNIAVATAEENMAFNNIFTASTGLAIHITDNTWNNWMDYNCYYSDGDNVAKIGLVNYANANGIWTGYSTVFGTTELHSIVSDPQFVDFVNGDYRPQNANLRLIDGSWIGSESPTYKGAKRINRFSRF